MAAFGYALSSEDHGPADLVRNARLAEEAGFEFAMVSDHFHPWTDSQGQSPFVWSVTGGVGEATERLRLGTGGSRMLEEAIEIMHLLWQGGEQTHRGEFYDVEQAHLYTLPEQPVEIAVAAAKPKAAEPAGRLGDAFINTAPDTDVIRAFETAGGTGKPRYGQITGCWAASEQQGAKTTCEIFPNAALGGDLGYELPLPRHYEQATEDVTPEEIAEAIPCGPDADRWLEDIRAYEEAGYTYIFFHQIGYDQEGFFRFLSEELEPKL